MLFKENSHPFLQELLKSFSQNYNPKIWGDNGPVLLLKAIKQYCNFTEDFEIYYQKLMFVRNSSQSSSEHCDITIFPENYFYPFKYFNETKLLITNNGLSSKERLKHTYSLHMYGAFTRLETVELNGNSLFDYAARKNCPATYKYMLIHRLNFLGDQFWYSIILYSLVFFLILVVCFVIVLPLTLIILRSYRVNLNRYNKQSI